MCGSSLPVPYHFPRESRENVQNVRFLEPLRLSHAKNMGVR